MPTTITFDVPPIAPLLADIDQMRRLFDMTEGSLGESLLDETVQDILHNCASMSDPDGNPWANLTVDYAAEKQKDVGFVYPIGVREQLMLQQPEIEGSRVIVPDSASMEYGTDDRNRLVAESFQEGTPNGRKNEDIPARPFYGIGQAMAAKADAMLEARFMSFH
jgi:hypothetical protein